MALLRNMAVLSTQRDEFVASGAIRGVLEVISLWGQDQELLLNASRLLSKLSMTPSCQDEMAAIQPSVHSTLLQVASRLCGSVPVAVLHALDPRSELPLVSFTGIQCSHDIPDGY